MVGWMNGRGSMLYVSLGISVESVYVYQMCLSMCSTVVELFPCLLFCLCISSGLLFRASRLNIACAYAEDLLKKVSGSPFGSSCRLVLRLES